MKKLFLSLLFLLFLFNSSFSQDVMNPFGTLSDFGFISIPATETNNNIEGSPYITENYVPAKISVLKNKIYRVKYNALLDEILILGDDDSTYGIDKHGRKDITITILASQKTYQVFNYLDDRDFETIGYFIHMSNPDSTIKLLKKERIKFYPGKKAINSYSQSEPAQYKREDDKYYVKIKDQIAVLFVQNKKKIARLFPNLEKEILHYIKSNNINVKDETDLIKLVEYINQIY